jgi:hypothetical protein
MKGFSVVLLLFFLTLNAGAQDSRVPADSRSSTGGRISEDGRTAIMGTVEWEKMELYARVTLNLAASGIRMPTGRSQAEELLKVEYPSLIRPYILSIPVDSSTTLEDLINSGDLAFQTPDRIAASARRLPPALSVDLSALSASYTINLGDINTLLIRHSRPAELPRLLNPVPAASYTGIIIIAGGELPIQGKKSEALVQPCLFPKVWDTEMNLIYERNILDPGKSTLVRYITEDSIFRPTPSGLSPELSALVGDNPMRILARGVFGITPTDPIIDREDALIILSSEQNRLLLREGKVAIVLSREALRGAAP